MKNILLRIFRFLASMRTGITLFCVLLAAGIVGSFLPFSVSTRWIYRSLWFNTLLSLICLSTVACLIARFPFRKKNIPGFLLHLGIPLLAAGFIQYNLFSSTGTISFSAGESSRTAAGASGKTMSLPFVLKLENFVAEKNPVSVSHILEMRKGKRMTRYPFTGLTNIAFAAEKVTIDAILRDFRILEGRRITDVSTNWNNPAIRIRSSTGEGWLFAFHPQFSTIPGAEGISFTYKFKRTGGTVSRFASTLRVTPEAPGESFDAIVEVNKPLRIGGYTVYQYSYDPEKPGWTELLIRKESGNILILAGFFLICVGLFWLLALKTILAKEKQ